MKIVLLPTLLAAAAVGFYGQTTNTSLDRSGKTLREANSLTASFIQISGVSSPINGTLAFSKPDRFRIETPEHLTISDGKTIWDLDKSNNTYTEDPATLDRILENDTISWAAFFAKEPFKDAKRIDAGVKRVIKTIPVQELVIERPTGKSVTVYLDAKTGVARGSSAKKGDEDLTTFATKFELSPTTLPADTFNFTPPAGSKKTEKLVDVPFSKVAAIFTTSCISCHAQGNSKGGLDLSTYQGVMAGGRSGAAVIPGDAKNSLLLQLVNGTKQPAMPKRAAPLSAEQVKAIQNWIQSGAKQ